MKKTCRLVSRIYRAAVVLLVSAFLCGAPGLAAEPEGLAIDWKKGQLSHLVPAIGTYRFEQVFDDPHVKQSMQELLGRDLPHFLKNFDVRSPISFSGTELVLSGAHAHEADKEAAILVVRIRDGSIHAGLMVDGRKRIYSKEISYDYLPAVIRRWVSHDAIKALSNTKPGIDFDWAPWVPPGPDAKPENIWPAAPTPVGARVEFRQPAEGETSPYAELLNDLQARLQRYSPGQDIYRREGLLSYGLVDLNGDGRNEVVVHGSSSIWCGNNPKCLASVYTRKDDGWRYIGEVFVREGHYPVMAYIFVEDRLHKGWRILNDGEYRYCWVADPEKSAIHVSGDTFKMPRAAGEPGYHWAVHMNEQCPDK